MRNIPKDWDIEVEYKDVQSVNKWKKYKKLYRNEPEKLAEGRELIRRKGRDSSRVPMQFDSTSNAGFCKEGVKPWMRVMDDYQTVNAKAQMEYQDDTQISVWQFWQRALQDRKEHKDVFVYGDFHMVDESNEKIFTYLRTGETGGTWLIALNWCGDMTDWEIPKELKVEWMAGTYVKGRPKHGNKGTIKLQPWEGLLAKCQA
jgi:oligo-1,6-glucosidase